VPREERMYVQAVEHFRDGNSSVSVIVL
jgi:hypothetical protein